MSSRTDPRPGTLSRPLDPRHADLDEDSALLPRAWSEQVRRVRATARQDLRKLLELPVAERVARVEETESRRSFRSHALAGLLLQASRERLLTDPAEAENLARVADRVLLWIPGPPGEPWRQAARGRALAHGANARRCAGDLVAAERAFQRLRTRRLHEPLEDLRLAAEAAGWEAALRWRQGHWEDAVELLAEAVEAHRRRGARLEMARALGRRSDVLRSVGRADRAVGCLEWALQVLESVAFSSPRRFFRVRLGHALVEAGRCSGAARCLAEARGEKVGGDTVGTADGLVADLAWLEARLEAGRKGGPGVRPPLREVRNHLSSAGRLGEAVLAVLDGLAVGGGEGERERVARWLGRRVVEGVDLGAGVRKWTRLLVARLETGAVEGDELAGLRRALFREVALAEWGAE